MSKDNGTQTTGKSASTTLIPPMDTLDLPSNLIVKWDGNARTNADPAYLKELASSIKRDGLLQPVGVMRIGDAKTMENLGWEGLSKHQGKFLLFYGFSRFEAVTGKSEGLLARDIIRAKTFDPMSEKELRLLNLVENMQRENLSHYDVAHTSNILRTKFEMSGAAIANKVGKSSSYVNNLIRAVVNCSPAILKLWREEQMPGYTAKRVVTPDWLNRVSKGELGKPEFDHATQDKELLRIQGKLPEENTAGTSGEGGGGGEPAVPAGNKRAGLRDLKAALAAAEEKRKEAKDAAKRERYQGIIEAIRFAMGTADIIKGVYTGKPDKDEEDEDAEEN
jgi:ParB-like chromosome segregation protein Spo0J